jgi:hypothetical protein
MRISQNVYTDRRVRIFSCYGDKLIAHFQLKVSIRKWILWMRVISTSVVLTLLGSTIVNAETCTEKSPPSFPCTPETKNDIRVLNPPIAANKYQLVVSILGLENIEPSEIINPIVVKGYLEQDESVLRLYLAQSDALTRNNVHSIIVLVPYNDQPRIEQDCAKNYTSIFGGLERPKELNQTVLVPEEISRYERDGDGDVIVETCWQKPKE